MSNIAFTPCRICGRKEGPEDLPGFYYVPLENGSLGVEECECHKDWTRKNLLRIRAKRANIWSSDSALAYNENSYVGQKSSHEVSKLKKYIDNFVEKDPRFMSTVLYMYGPHGTQKTHLAQWIGLSLLNYNFKVQYTLMQTLITSLSPEFNNSKEQDEDKQSLADSLLNADCLIIDESFQAEKVTLYKSKYQLPFLETFLRTRIDILQKSTIFISNVKPSEIDANGFEKSLESFVQRNTVAKKTLLTFEDVYDELQNQFDVEGIFDNV